MSPVVLRDGRVMASLCAVQVAKKIRELMADGEAMDILHESHDVFRREHDEQLVQWMNRSLRRARDMLQAWNTLQVRDMLQAGSTHLHCSLPWL